MRPHLLNHQRREEGGSVGTGKKSRLSEELMRSFKLSMEGLRGEGGERVWEGRKWDYKPLRGFVF